MIKFSEERLTIQSWISIEVSNASSLRNLMNSSSALELGLVTMDCEMAVFRKPNTATAAIYSNIFLPFGKNVKDFVVFILFDF